MKALLAVLVLAAMAAPLPKSAEIIHANGAGPGDPYGNIKVTFTDGHAEMWDQLGKSEMPKVSGSGLVGWVKYEDRNARGWPVPNKVRVCWPDGHHKDFQMIEAPFIQGWWFVDNDTSIVVQSMCAHGPFYYSKFNIATGEMFGTIVDHHDKPLPDWAQPYADKD